MYYEGIILVSCNIGHLNENNLKFDLIYNIQWHLLLRKITDFKIFLIWFEASTTEVQSHIIKLVKMNYDSCSQENWTLLDISTIIFGKRQSVHFPKHE